MPSISRRFQALAFSLVATAPLLLVGCPTPPAPPQEGPGAEVPVKPEVAQDDEAEVKALEAEGATLVRNDAGNVTEVKLGVDGNDDNLVHLKGLPALIRVEASVRGVTDAGMVHLAGLPTVRTLVLELSSVTDAGMADLAKMPALEDIQLKRCDLTSKGYEELAKIKTLKRIRAPQTNFNDDCIAAIKDMTQLELLDLQDCNQVTEAGLAPLKNFTKLKSLRIYGPTITDTVMTYIADAKNLASLSLEQSAVGVDGMKTIGTLSKLKELKLYGASNVTDDALAQIADLKDLEILELRSTTTTSGGMKHLAGLSKLKVLDLSETANIGNDGIAALAPLTNLEELNLWYTFVDDQGLAPLASMTKMKRLNLDKCQVTDAGLVNLKGLSNLEFLHIGSTRVTDTGLVELEGLKNLKHLVITFCNDITDDGVTKLQAALPGLEKIER